MSIAQIKRPNTILRIDLYVGHAVHQDSRKLQRISNATVHQEIGFLAEFQIWNANLH